MKSRKVIMIILLTALLVVLFAVVASADDSLPTSGSCGDNVTWEFDSSTGTLTIRGAGEMDWFGIVNEDDFTRTAAPWGEQFRLIRNVVVEDGVTNLNNYAFSGCAALSSVTLADSVKWLGYNTFSGCSSLKVFTIPKGLTALEPYTFEGCSALTDFVVDAENAAFSAGMDGCHNAIDRVVKQHGDTVCCRHADAHVLEVCHQCIDTL